MTEFGVLGQLEALADGRPVDLGGARQRAVLAVLLAHANQPVSTERLVTGVWGAEAPPTATKTAQVYISRLRRTLGDDSLETTPGGYVLRVPSGAVDVDEAELLRERARDAAPREAGMLLREGLGLWRGPAYADLRYEPALQGEIARLDELRLSMLEERVEADIAAGRTTDLIPELQALVREHPLRERLRGSLMLALYRSGRQAEALDAFADGRRLLVDELGLEPGPELRELERAILTQDPAIAGPPRSPRLPARRRAGALVAVGGALLALAAVSGIALVLHRDGSTSRLVETPTQSLVGVDPSTGEARDVVSLPSDPVALAAGKRALWAASADSRMLTRIDPASLTTRRVAVQLVPSSVAVGADAVWVGGSGSPGLTAIDPVFLQPRERGLQRVGWPSSVRALAVGDGSVWAGTDDAVVRIDGHSGRVLRRYPAEGGVDALAFGGGVLFVGTRFGGILRIDPVSGISARTPVSDAIAGLAVRGRVLWVVGRYTTTVWQLDAGNLVLVGSTDVDTEPGGTIANATGIAVSGESTWISSELGVRRLDSRNDDPNLREIGTSRDFAARPRAIVASGGRVWLAVTERRELAATPAQRTLRFNRSYDGDFTLDPALALEPVSFQREFATCAKLVTYPDRPGRAALQIVPELARELPAVSSDGLTYTFRVRDDMRFSPPSNARVVTAADVKATIERALSPTWPDDPPPGGFFLRDIAGAPAYLAGKAGGISGIAVSGDRLTIRLQRPVPDLLHRLALPFFCVLPKGAPIVAGGLSGGQLPTAGPYYVASGRVGDDSHTIVLRRNPNYRGDRPRVPDRIVYSIGPDGVEIAGALDRGAADYSDDQMTEATYARLIATAGRGTPAARAGRQRIFRGRTPFQYYLQLNSGRPLFRDARMRRAVAHALDRPTLLRAVLGAHAGAPNDQFLIPGALGFRDARISRLDGPDFARARAEAKTPRARAVLWVPSSEYAYIQPQDVVTSLRRSLRGIGLELVVKKIDNLGARVTLPGAAWDMFLFGWGPDYPDPSSTLNHMFETGYPAGDGVTLSAVVPFSDPALDRDLRAAARLYGRARLDAYARLDERLSRAGSAVIPIGGIDQLDAFSERVGCQRFHPLYGIVLGALCFRR